MRRSFFVLVVAAVFCFGSHQGRAADAPAFAAVKARHERLQNWTAHFEVETTFDGGNAESNQRVSQSVVFRFLKGRAIVESVLDEAGKKAYERGEIALEYPRKIRSVTPERSETLIQTSDVEAPAGMIADGGNFFEPWWTIDTALGLRLFEEPSWLTEEDLAKAAQAIDQESTTLTFQGSSGSTSVVRYGREVGFGVTSYRLNSPRPGEYQEISCSDFKLVNGLHLPFKIVRTNVVQDSDGKPRTLVMQSIIVRTYVLDDPKNTRETMMIVWPAKSEVFDTRSGFRLRVGETPRMLPDAALAAEMSKLRQYDQGVEERARQRLGGASTQPAK